MPEGSNVVAWKTVWLWLKWLPKDKKTNMWHGRGKCCGLWPPAFPAPYIIDFFSEGKLF